MLILVPFSVHSRGSSHSEGDCDVIGDEAASAQALVHIVRRPPTIYSSRPPGHHQIGRPAHPHHPPEGHAHTG